MRVLALDTSLSACSVCILDLEATKPLAAESLFMEKGHAEALIPLLQRVLSKVTGGIDTVQRVVVVTGPGSFTGLRVALTTARTIGLMQKIPVVGVSSLSAYLAPMLIADRTRLAIAAIDAKHNNLFVQAITPSGRDPVGREIIAPKFASLREIIREVGSGPLTISGSGAPLLAAEAWSVGLDAKIFDPNPAPDITWVARLGQMADPQQSKPEPFYLRAPDAAPQGHVALARRL